MKKIGIYCFTFLIVMVSVSIVFADGEKTKMVPAEGGLYRNSVPGANVEDLISSDNAVIEQIRVRNYIEKAPSKTPGADIVKNADVTPVVLNGQMAGGATLADGTTVAFYSYDDYNNFVENNIDNAQEVVSLYIDYMTDIYLVGGLTGYSSGSGAISNDYSSGSIAGYGSSISVSYDSYITQVGEDIIIAPLAQYEGSIIGYFEQGQISVGAGSTISASSSIEITETLPMETIKDKGDTKRGTYNKNVRDKMDKRNKEIHGRIDEI